MLKGLKMLINQCCICSTVEKHVRQFKMRYLQENKIGISFQQKQPWNIRASDHRRNIKRQAFWPAMLPLEGGQFWPVGNIFSCTGPTTVD